MELRAVEVQPLVTTDLIAAVQRPMTTTASAATTVYANAEVLRRVLEQRVDNAETPAELAVIAEPTAVLFRIADRGAGTPHAQRESAFDAHVRAGLAYCRAAVEAFGGRVWSEGTAPAGAVDGVRLPDG